MVKKSGASCDGFVNPSKCLVYFNNFILVINASSGFFVYCFIGSFGEKFMEVLSQNCRRGKSASNTVCILSGHFSQRQAWMEVVKIKNPDFSYWAWSTPWGHVLSLKSFCWNPVLSWAIRYSVFQPVKFSRSLSSSAAQFFQLFDI